MCRGPHLPFAEEGLAFLFFSFANANAAIVDLLALINCIVHCAKGGIFIAKPIMSEPACKNIFKHGENTVSAAQFTQKWIELINRLEKGKEELACDGQ